MNLYVVPKYKKYNKTLKQLHFATLQPEQSLSRVYVEGSKPLPFPVTVNLPHNNDPKNKDVHETKHVHVKESPPATYSDVRDIYFRSEDDTNAVSKWYKKKKALKSLEHTKKEEKKRLDEWQKWKKRERELILKVENENSPGGKKQKVRKREKKLKKINEKLEKAKQEREKEFYDQMMEQQKYKAELAKHTLKTRHPKSLRKVKMDTYPASGDPFPLNKEPEREITTIKQKPPKKEKIKKQKQPKKKKKENYHFDKSANAKPDYSSRYSHAKEKKPKDALARRFVNCFYRFCCEFFCWMSIILGIALVYVMLVP